MSAGGEVKIDQGIPIPNAGCGHGRKRYPWDKMEVGDSFLHESEKPSSVSGQASMAGSRLGFKFSTRKTEEGYRVWRVA